MPFEFTPPNPPSPDFPLPPGVPPIPPAYASPEGYTPRHELANHIQEIQITPLQTALNGVKECFGRVQAWRQERREARQGRKREKLEDKIKELEQEQAFREDMGARSGTAAKTRHVGPRTVEPVTRQQRRTETRMARRAFKQGVEKAKQARIDRLIGSGSGSGSRSSRESLLLTTSRRHELRKGARRAYKHDVIDAVEFERRKRAARGTYVHDEFMHQKKRRGRIRGGDIRMMLDSAQPIRYRRTAKKLKKLRNKLAELENND